MKVKSREWLYIVMVFVLGSLAVSCKDDDNPMNVYGRYAGTLTYTLSDMSDTSEVQKQAVEFNVISPNMLVISSLNLVKPGMVDTRLSKLTFSNVTYSRGGDDTYDIFMERPKWLDFELTPNVNEMSEMLVVISGKFWENTMELQDFKIHFRNIKNETLKLDGSFTGYRK